jgi:hypothetical protein
MMAQPWLTPKRLDPKLSFDEPPSGLVAGWHQPEWHLLKLNVLVIHSECSGQMITTFL